MSNRAVQQRTHRCDCGQQAQVTNTGSEWEFDWQCVCERTGTLSWAHAAPPPAFAPERQRNLFDDLGGGTS